uniref:Secreted protein n=1 Tax=Cacopsylla melanoneura TaxID=428564 RepID=A0A8D9BYJ1_9HEMI
MHCKITRQDIVLFIRLVLLAWGGQEHKPCKLVSINASFCRCHFVTPCTYFLNVYFESKTTSKKKGYNKKTHYSKVPTKVVVKKSRHFNKSYCKMHSSRKAYRVFR